MPLWRPRPQPSTAPSDSQPRGPRVGALVLAPIAAAAILAAGYYTLEGGKLVTKCGSLAEMLGTCGRMYVFGALAAFGILCFIGMRGRRTIAP